MEGVPMNEDQLQEIRDAFRAFEPTGHGKINAKQMGMAMRTLGHCPTEAELYDIFDEIDTDYDGEIDLNEFEQMIVKRMEALSKDANLMTLFKLFDRDDDGYISAAELRSVMYNLGERCSDEEFNEMMKEIDTDNDGKLSYHDFVNGVKN